MTKLLMRRIAGVVLLFIALQFEAQGASYSYDNAGRLTKVDYGSAGVVLYSYDPAGNLVSRQVQPAQAQGPGTPVITAVVNAESGSALIAPNTWVALYGTNLSPAGDSRAWKAPDDFANNRLPTQLDNVTVTVNGKSAFVYYISPTQVNILTPPDPMTGSVQVQLTNGAATSASFAVDAKSTSPAFFIFGGGPYVVAQHANYSLVGPTTLYSGLTTPAAPGETILIYANGFGSTAPPVTSEQIAQAGNLPTLPVLTIGGVNASVQFAGLVLAGLYQLNVVVPSNLQSGDYDLTATYGALKTQSGVKVTVQH